MTIMNFIWSILAMIVAVIIAFFISLILRSMLQTPKGQKPKILSAVFNLNFIKDSLRELL